MGDDFMFQLFGKYRDMALAVKNPCHLNMAACLIKLKRYEEAIGQCSIVSISFYSSTHHDSLSTKYSIYPLIDSIQYINLSQVLTEDENNLKALFRRGKARTELGQTDAAKEDFLKAQKFAPQDKAIAKELRLLAEHDKAVYQKQKEIYKGIFGPSPEPKPKSTNWLVLFWQWLISLFYRLFKRDSSKSDWHQVRESGNLNHCSDKSLLLLLKLLITDKAVKFYEL